MFNSFEEMCDYLTTEYDDEEIFIFDIPYNYYSAFIGLTTDLRAVYDYDLMYDYLLKEGVDRDDIGMTIDDAINSTKCYNPDKAPIIIFTDF